MDIHCPRGGQPEGPSPLPPDTEGEALKREPMIISPELLKMIEERLAALDPDIRALARTWSRDHPDAREDLAQEVRLAIHRELLANPDSPRNHLFQRARHVIIDYRKRGKSVDGKLNRTHRRRQVWKLASLDADPGVARAVQSRQLRPVEDLALARVAYGELRERLTEQQAQYLGLRLQGYTGREVDCLLGLSKQQGLLLRRKIQEAAQECLTDQVIAGGES